MFVDLFDHTSSHRWSLAVPVHWHTRNLSARQHALYVYATICKFAGTLAGAHKQLNNLRTESDYFI